MDYNIGLLCKNNIRYANGIIVVYEDLSGTGCYSSLGKAPGWNGRSPHTITELGGAPGWQIMSQGTLYYYMTHII